MTPAVDRAAWPHALVFHRCACGELDVEHAIRANGSRGACSVSRGPRATPCGCRDFTPAAGMPLEGPQMPSGGDEEGSRVSST